MYLLLYTGIRVNHVSKSLNTTYYIVTCHRLFISGAYSLVVYIVMTSSYGNISRVNGPLRGKTTGHRWIPLKKTSDSELWCFLWSAPYQTMEQTIDTPVIWDSNVMLDLHAMSRFIVSLTKFCQWHPNVLIWISWHIDVSVYVITCDCMRFYVKETCWKEVRHNELNSISHEICTRLCCVFLSL